MYKLLIVEDDKLYRQELCTQIHWESYGFSLSGDAKNGKDALSCIAHEIPDLVITDISMPVMNGIQLIQILKENYPEIHILVLSSYDDFNFVKDAMKFGAEDYILKYSIEEANLNTLLSQIKAKIDQEKNESDRTRLINSNLDKIIDNYLRNALLGVPGSIKELANLWKILELPGSPERLTVLFLMIEDLDKPSFQELRNFIFQTTEPWLFYVQIDSNSAAVLLCTREIISRLQILNIVADETAKLFRKLNEMGSAGFSVGVSNTISDVAALPQVYQQAEFAASQYIYEGYGKVFFYVNMNKSQPTLKLEDFREKIKTDLSEGSKELVCKEIDEFIQRLYIARPPKSKLLEELLSLYHILYRASIEEKLDFKAITGFQVVTERILDSLHSLSQIKELVLSAYQNYFNEIQKRELQVSGESYNNRYIKDIMEFINKNYMREISLNSLSEEFNLTPNYLCRLFRNNTGMKLTDYINRVRIEGAKKLLDTTNMKVYEIAECVGFSSSSYFCTVFKTLTGIKVSEYKRS